MADYSELIPKVSKVVTDEGIKIVKWLSKLGLQGLDLTQLLSGNDLWDKVSDSLKDSAGLSYLTGNVIDKATDSVREFVLSQYPSNLINSVDYAAYITRILTGTIPDVWLGMANILTTELQKTLLVQIRNLIDLQNVMNRFYALWNSLISGKKLCKEYYLKNINVLFELIAATKKLNYVVLKMKTKGVFIKHKFDGAEKDIQQALDILKPLTTKEEKVIDDFKNIFKDPSQWKKISEAKKAEITDKLTRWWRVTSEKVINLYTSLAQVLVRITKCHFYILSPQKFTFEFFRWDNESCKFLPESFWKDVPATGTVRIYLRKKDKDGVGPIGIGNFTGDEIKRVEEVSRTTPVVCLKKGLIFKSDNNLEYEYLAERIKISTKDVQMDTFYIDTPIQSKKMGERYKLKSNHTFTIDTNQVTIMYNGEDSDTKKYVITEIKNLYEFSGGAKFHKTKEYPIDLNLDLRYPYALSSGMQWKDPIHIRSNPFNCTSILFLLEGIKNFPSPSSWPSFLTPASPMAESLWEPIKESNDRIKKLILEINEKNQNPCSTIAMQNAWYIRLLVLKAFLDVIMPPSMQDLVNQDDYLNQGFAKLDIIKAKLSELGNYPQIPMLYLAVSKVAVGILRVLQDSNDSKTPMKNTVLKKDMRFLKNHIAAYKLWLTRCLLSTLDFRGYTSQALDDILGIMDIMGWDNAKDMIEGGKIAELSAQIMKYGAVALSVTGIAIKLIGDLLGNETNMEKRTALSKLLNWLNQQDKIKKSMIPEKYNVANIAKMKNGWAAEKDFVKRNLKILKK